MTGLIFFTIAFIGLMSLLLLYASLALDARDDNDEWKGLK